MSTSHGINDYVRMLKSLHDKWQANENQARLINEIFGQRQVKRVFIRGGRKASKTESSLYISHRICASGRGRVCTTMAPLKDQQRRNLWDNLRLPDFAPSDWGGRAFESRMMVRFPNQSYTQLGGSDNTEAHRGAEKDFLGLDELKDHKTDSYIAMEPDLLPRKGLLFCCGSPPRSKKGIYYELEQHARESPDWYFAHWTCWDNEHNDVDELHRIKAQLYKRGDGHIWESEYEAKYVFGGRNAVFSVFAEDIHEWTHDAITATLEKDKQHLEYYIVTDPGNRICHATLFIAFDRTNNHVWVLDEHYETEQKETATGRIFPRIMEKADAIFPDGADPWYIYDEAALWYATELMAQFPHAPALSPTSKALKNKETSMGVIKDCMANEHYVQSDRCKNLKEEITSYYTDEEGRYPKVGDHAIDCLRYFFDHIGYSHVLATQPRERISEFKEMGIARKIIKPGEDDLFDILDFDEDDEWMFN